MEYKSIRIYPKINENFESCSDCIHCDDSEEVCRARLCIHAISELYECYEPKVKESD